MKRIMLSTATAAILTGCVQSAIPSAIAESAPIAPFNSDRFDLSNWKITIPEVSDPNFEDSNDHEDHRDDDDAAEIYNLVGYEHPQWFFDGPDGAMVFVAPVDGVTTSGSRYPRSELREMRYNDEAEWQLDEGGTMSATVSVDQVPERDDGKPGRLIVGQIHGEDDELVRLYYQDSTVYFVNEHAGEEDEELDFKLLNAAGEEPDIALGERFSYLIDARGDTLTVEVHADGDVYRSVSEIIDVWQDDVFYFKAGLYLGVNDETGSGVGRVSFYALDLSHTHGQGRGGLR